MSTPEGGIYVKGEVDSQGTVLLSFISNALRVQVSGDIATVRMLADTLNRIADECEDALTKHNNGGGTQAPAKA